MLLCYTCLRFRTLHDKITYIAFLLWRLFPCTCARIINSLCLSVWFICENLARGILPLGALTRARVTITQRLNFFCSNIIHISLGNKAYQRIASFACLACCHLQGFFLLFTMPTLFFSFPSHFSCQHRFYTLHGSTWFFVQNPPPFHS